MIDYYCNCLMFFLIVYVKNTKRPNKTKKTVKYSQIFKAINKIKQNKSFFFSF